MLGWISLSESFQKSLFVSPVNGLSQCRSVLYLLFPVSYYINIGLATTKHNCPTLETDIPKYRIDYTMNYSHENANGWERSGERATAAYLSARPY